MGLMNWSGISMRLMSVATFAVSRFPQPIQMVQSLRVRRRPPTFPPVVWNVHEVSLRGGDRTNNICEGWNNAFQSLVGHKHPGVFSLIEGFQQDCALVIRLEKNLNVRNVAAATPHSTPGFRTCAWLDSKKPKQSQNFLMVLDSVLDCNNVTHFHVSFLNAMK